MGVSILENTLIHYAFKVILGLAGKIAFAVERATVLCWGDVILCLHPLQYVHAIAVHQFRECHFLIGRGKQPSGKAFHIIAHFLNDVFRLDALCSTALGVLRNELSKADGFIVRYVYHIHQHRLLHGLHIFGCQPEVCGVFCQVLLIDSRLFGLSCPHLAKCCAPVVALYHLSTCVYRRCACVGRYR